MTPAQFEHEFDKLLTRLRAEHPPSCFVLNKDGWSPVEAEINAFMKQHPGIDVAARRRASDAAFRTTH